MQFRTPLLLTIVLLALGQVACRPARAVAPPARNPTAEDALAWLLETIERGGTRDRSEIDRWFAPAFLQAIPPKDVIATLAEVARAMHPVKVVERHGEPPLELVARLESAAGPRRVSIQMTAEAPRQIIGLLFASDEPPPRSYDEAITQLSASGAEAQLFVAELVDGACQPRLAHHDRARMALGSTFKLWVLLALDSKLRAAGGAGWDAKLAIREELKSLPSGELQDRPAGTEYTLREFATKMIAISDNTATDHLIAYVGRAAVEAAQRDAGHATPEVNLPWLTTREIFTLKLAASEAELAAYRSADVAGKRAMLERLAGRPLDGASMSAWTTPRALDIEWFATAHDTCNVLAALAARGKYDPDSELLRVLAANPLPPTEPAQYRYLGFKGGSEPGVMHGAWLLQRAEGRWFVVVVAVNDPARPVDETKVLNVGRGVMDVLGREQQ